MKTGISVFLFALLATFMGYFYFNKTSVVTPVKEKLDSVVATIYEHDLETNEIKELSSISYVEGNTIYLSKYNGSDITIEEVTDKKVKISRDKITYKIVDKDKKISKLERTTLHESIDMNEKIFININETDPFGPQLTKPRYSYSIRFTKE